jgi:hypothetical protein
MKEINEIIEHLVVECNYLGQKNLHLKGMIVKKQLDNANKVKAKLQGAIDLFKEIEEL